MFILELIFFITSIILLMEDVWSLSRNLNIYCCCHIYWEANRSADCLAKNGIFITDSYIWRINFP